jgi:hypothetical protein
VQQPIKDTLETMSEPFYPPPPPPTPASDVSEEGLHGPKTNFFLGIRRTLTALETPPNFKTPAEPKRLFLVAFLLALPLGAALLAVVVHGIAVTARSDAATILNGFLTSLLVESVLILLAVLLWGFAPNRRYGAAMGMLFGLGFAVGYEILFVSTYGIRLPWSVLRLLTIPFIQPVAAAFEGIGVFVLLARRRQLNSFTQALLGLPLLFFFFGFIHRMSYALISLSAVPVEAGYIIGYLLLFPIFAIILRDLLGGHFNFQHFLDPLPEPDITPQMQPAPPPPP